MLFKGGVLSSMGWQHHPPRHAAARAALGVQAAHATLGMAPPHMPPSSPRHANAKRARPRHRGEPSHAAAVTPCPAHAAPGTRPMPPMRTRCPVPPRLGSTPRASMLPRKNVPMANVAAHPGGSPMPPARRCPSKGTRMPLPPMQREPSPGARPPVSARRGALKPSSEHVASERSQTHRRHAYIGPTKASLVAPVCWSGVASGRVAVRRVMPCRSEPDGV